MSEPATQPSEYCEAKHPDPDLDVPGCVLLRDHDGDHQGWLMPDFRSIWWPKQERSEGTK